MLKFSEIIILLSVTTSVLCHFSGPFMLWGVDELKTVKLSALEPIDDLFLRNLYTESTAIVLFLRNSTSKLSDQNYPAFKKIVEKNQWAYVPQKCLTSDPVDYNVNAEIIHLVGSPNQQDAEISLLYNEAILNYGHGRVLGMLATKSDEHDIIKRQAEMNVDAKDSTSESEVGKEGSSSTTNSPPQSTTTSVPSGSTTPIPDENINNTDCSDCIYNKEGRALLHTTSPPLLEHRKEVFNKTANRTDITTSTIELKSYKSVTYDQPRAPKTEDKMIILFTINGEKLYLRFRFEISQQFTYWTLNSVEVESLSDNYPSGNLTVEGEAPSAPVGFSYFCRKPLTFSNENKTMILRFQNIQVQARMNGNKAFGDAFDCIGFTTAPIWSGLLVSFLLIFGVSIAICAILDIKPPNRFENNRSKQLTFTIQE